MPAATCKADLLDVHYNEFAKLATLLDGIDADLAQRPFEDGATIKDTVAHRAHWIELFLGWYADGQAGTEVFFPAKGYKWSDLKAYNAALREAQKDLDWSEARTLLQANHERLLSFLQHLDEAALYGGPMKGAKNNWTTGRWAEAAGPSHYRSAAKFIRKCVKRAG